MPIETSMGTISGHFLILVASKPRLFKVTTSNTWYYKNYRTFLLQIFFISRRMPIGTSIGTISSHFLILLTSKPRLFKGTTSNTWYYKNYRTFLLQIFFISNRMPIGTSMGTISSHFLILVTSKPRLFKFITSNTWYYKNYRTFLLQIFFISRRMPIGTSIGTISSHFLILLTSKPRLFKGTTSNTWYYKNYRTFLLQIFFISNRMPIGTSIRTISSHSLILFTSKPRFFKVTTSNTWYYKNYRTFLLQILLIWRHNYFSMGVFVFVLHL